MVCFIESFAASETPWEMTDTSRGSIRLSMLAITENSRLNPDFLVDTKSSETPPPSTPEIRQLTTAAAGDEEGKALRLAVKMVGSNGRMRRWCENGGGG